MPNNAQTLLLLLPVLLPLLYITNPLEILRLELELMVSSSPARFLYTLYRPKTPWLKLQLDVEPLLSTLLPLCIHYAVEAVDKGWGMGRKALSEIWIELCEEHKVSLGEIRRLWGELVGVVAVVGEMVEKDAGVEITLR